MNVHAIHLHIHCEVGPAPGVGRCCFAVLHVDGIVLMSRTVPKCCVGRIRRVGNGGSARPTNEQRQNGIKGLASGAARELSLEGTVCV